LPKRFLAESQATNCLQQMIAAYNLARGWTSDGWIPEAELMALGVGDLA
jgi:hypothetical protein